MVIDNWTKVEDGLPELPDGTYASVHCLVTIISSGKPATLAMDYVRTTVRGKKVERWEWMNRISPWEVLGWMYFPKPMGSDW